MDTYGIVIIVCPILAIAFCACFFYIYKRHCGSKTSVGEKRKEAKIKKKIKNRPTYKFSGGHDSVSYIGDGGDTGASSWNTVGEDGGGGFSNGGDCGGVSSSWGDYLGVSSSGGDCGGVSSNGGDCGGVSSSWGDYGGVSSSGGDCGGVSSSGGDCGGGGGSYD